jgi:hypothetical protein
VPEIANRYPVDGVLTLARGSSGSSFNPVQQIHQATWRPAYPRIGLA